MRSLVLQHDHNAPAGLLGDWLEAQGTIAVVRMDRGEPAAGLAAGGGFDLLVTLGSDQAADDDAVPWQADERAALAAADAARVPILGVCFGAQSLARALGGEVRRAARPELGWAQVGTRVPELIEDGPWFEWHDDELVPPPGAEVLAANASGVQAYRAGRHLGVQFHPEVTREIVAGWDPPDAAVLEERHFAHPERAHALFDALLSVTLADAGRHPRG